jgi:arylsulfatase A-like enzyme
VIRSRLSRVLSAAAPVLTGFLRPPVIGAAYLLVLTAASLAFSYGDQRVQGVEVRSLRSLIESGYREEVSRVVALCLALAALTGVLLGAAGWVLVRARARLLNRSPPGLVREALGAWVLVALAHLAWVAHDAALRPQLYEDWLYARGGFRQIVHVFLTDRLGPTGVLVSALVLVAGWLFVPVAANARELELGRRLRRQLAEPRTPVMACVFAALMIVALAAASPRAPEAAPGRDRPNVLLIAVDSLRADRVDERVMPRLTRLAARGARFERAYVSLPRTFPSWVTLLTGRHPHRHGIRDMFPSWEARSVDLKPVPRHFAAAGYATLVVGDFAADIFRRIDLGFERVETPTFNFRELIRVRVLSAQPAILPLSGLGWIRRLVPSFDEMHNAADPMLLSRRALGAIATVEREPFLATVFFSALHFPYAAQEPYFNRFSDPGYRGRFKYGKANLLGREAPPDAADIRQIRAAYDGAAAAVDDALGALIDGLEARGLTERTVIVITADHGESLYESGRAQGHGDHLFGDETTHVPLIVLDPRRPGARTVRELVRDVDLAPTLCELAGIEPPTDGDGHSLVPGLDGQKLDSAFAYAETGLWFSESLPDVPKSFRIPYPDLTQLLELRQDHGDDLALWPELELLTTAAKHRMVRDERYKLVYAPTRSGAKYLLYDTAKDPDETRDVAADNPEIVRRLQEELWRWMLQDPAFERRGDFLVPRVAAQQAHAQAQKGIRLQEHNP